jgi:hypothetical protein
MRILNPFKKSYRKSIAERVAHAKKRIDDKDKQKPASMYDPLKVYEFGEMLSHDVRFNRKKR